MGEKTLVESQVFDSVELIKHLDSMGYQPSFAFWYFYDDAGVWRFIVVGEKFDRYLPKREVLAYKVIAEAISEKRLSSISISEIKVMKGTEPLTTAIKILVGTGPQGVARVYFKNIVVNGVFIKDVVVLRSS